MRIDGGWEQPLLFKNTFEKGDNFEKLPYQNPSSEEE